MKPTILNRLLPMALAALLLGLWQAWTTWADVPTYLVPSPWLIAQTLAQDWALLSTAWISTLQITAWAFVMALLLGSCIAFVMVQSRWLEAALLPYAILLQVTPIVAIAPLIIIWVKDPTQALVICATVVALFPIISNTTVGLRSVNPGLLDYFKLQGASRWQTLWRLRLPSALPYILAGWRISGGLALIGAIVAEFVAGTGGTEAGLAFQILQSGYQLNIPRLFAALTLVTVTGLIIFMVLSGLTRWALSGWHESERHVR
ncbi:MAG: ABC transporter permease [Aquabacterium sp.]|jgi:NitT/TauT family transport system permease protein|nr:ABC transporter permease [Aquabacterium sp.]